jgi:hypothetical protein
MNPLADNLFGEAVINYRIVIVITARCECTCAADTEGGGEHPILVKQATKGRAHHLFHCLYI